MQDRPNRRLSQNLDRLLALKGLGRKEAAEAIGVPYKWLRRAVSQGLGRPDQRNAPHLQRVTTFFGLRRIDDLWRPSLVELRLAPDRGNQESNGTCHTRRSATLDKLDDLLATGQHDYLYDLIDDLHRKAIPETPQEDETDEDLSILQEPFLEPVRRFGSLVWLDDLFIEAINVTPVSGQSLPLQSMLVNRQDDRLQQLPELESEMLELLVEWIIQEGSIQISYQMDQALLLEEAE